MATLVNNESLTGYKENNSVLVDMIITRSTFPARCTNIGGMLEWLYVVYNLHISIIMVASEGSIELVSLEKNPV